MYARNNFEQSIPRRPCGRAPSAQSNPSSFLSASSALFVNWIPDLPFISKYLRTLSFFVPGLKRAPLCHFRTLGRKQREGDRATRNRNHSHTLAQSDFREGCEPCVNHLFPTLTNPSAASLIIPALTKNRGRGGGNYR
jgi:hypothetical protein